MEIMLVLDKFTFLIIYGLFTLFYEWSFNSYSSDNGLD